MSDSPSLPRLDGVRVLVLFGAIPLHGQERGNIEVFRALAGLGLKARFITHRQWGHLAVQPELDRLELKWTTAPFGPLMGKNLFGPDIFRSLYGMLRTNWVLWREVRGWRPTHLHCMNWLYVLYATPLLFLLRIPMIYRLGDCPPQSTFLHRWLWRLICRRANSVVCISEFIHSELRQSGGTPRSSQVIYNLPPHRPGHLADASVQSPPGAMRLSYVGQISAEKGVPVLVEAARRCLSTGRNLSMCLAGDYSWQNPMAEALMAGIKAEGLEGRIQFLGYQENVPALLRASSLHVCPSMCREALGNVVLEAKAQGIPSVVFPDGGLSELIEHQVDGFICRDKTVESLVEGIEWFLDHPEERKRAGEAARRSLQEKFGERRFQRQWAEVFQSTAGAREREEC
ncbi:MAG: glycosyltransferase family 4 protein [Verrucomicrobia bacterium]|nr:glycosyltransferase family 4 protein [Verrucomicrobiota bacterium]